MGGSSFPSYGKSPAAAAAIGKPTLKQATAFKIPKGPAAKPARVNNALMRPMGFAKAPRAGFHVNTAIKRGHVVRGRLRG